MPVRIDLHVHSKHSSRPSQWILQKIGCPESFTEPKNLYRIAKLKGMTHVTITDHNKIDGALEIAHLPDTFVSEEITTYFPEDRCKIHVLALNISEAQHRDIQRVRENIYELVDYLVQTGILHIVAHPLYSVNGRLTIAHFEKLLLLFKNFEMNGARNDASNDALQRILDHLSASGIDRLANTHDIRPRVPKAWQKNITGGSDDHSSLNIARTFTEIPEADSLETAFKCIYGNCARSVRRPSTPLTLAHNLYGIAYQYYRNKLELDKYSGSDTLLDFLDHCLQPGPSKSNPGLITKLYCLWHYRKRPRLHFNVPKTLADLVRQESGRLLYDNPQLMQIAQTGATDSSDLERKWFDFVNQTAGRIALNFGQNLMSHLAGANVFNIFHTLGELGGLYALMAPYFISFSYFSQDRLFGEKIVRHFRSGNRDHNSAGTEEKKDRVVAHFTDRTASLPKLIEILMHKASKFPHLPENFTILNCGDPLSVIEPHIHTFQPVGTYVHPDFPENKLLFPPFMEMLDDCFSNRVTHLHSATPGPVGLAALGVARILKLPVYGTYHHTLSEYRPFLGEDESAGEILHSFMGWYYAQLDRIYVFSSDGHAHLTRYGVDPGKITLVPTAMDFHRARPSLLRRPKKSDRSGQDLIRLLYAESLAVDATFFEVASSENPPIRSASADQLAQAV